MLAIHPGSNEMRDIVDALDLNADRRKSCILFAAMLWNKLNSTDATIGEIKQVQCRIGDSKQASGSVPSLIRTLKGKEPTNATTSHRPIRHQTRPRRRQAAGA
jgi:hypothetical protein